jgi:hypothetical protein
MNMCMTVTRMDTELLQRPRIVVVGSETLGAVWALES